jgi:hypothetical protein
MDFTRTQMSSKLTRMGDYVVLTSTYDPPHPLLGKTLGLCPRNDAAASARVPLRETIYSISPMSRHSRAGYRSAYLQSNHLLSSAVGPSCIKEAIRHRALRIFQHSVRREFPQWACTRLS